MKRHFLAVALAAILLLSGCAGGSQQIPQGSAPQEPPKQSTVDHLSAEDFPSFGGCRALTALGTQTAAAVLDSSLDEARQSIRFSGSSRDAWNSLLDGTLDVALAYEPDEKTQESLKKNGVEWHAVAADALVFLVSKDCDVTEMTQSEIQAVYHNQSSGGMTGWHGAPGSSSREVFDRLFQPSGEEDWTPAYAGENDSLCYALAQTLETDGVPAHMRVIAVDGVKPTEHTIADGSYPLCVSVCAGLSKSAAGQDSALAVYQWLRSRYGMDFLGESARKSS